MVKDYFAFWETDPPSLTKGKVYDILERDRDKGYCKIIDDKGNEIYVYVDSRLGECFLEIC